MGLLALIEEASTISSHRIDPQDTVMIGDSDVDVMTAHHAGTRSLGCEFGLSPHALRLAGPDAMVASPAEWPAALGFTG
jgi:phosphoglycolate phosphatase